MQEWQVLSVEEWVSGSGTECWMVGYRRPDGALHSHVFPKFTLAQRVAEYDLDPADVDTILDIVLHEPFIPDPIANHANDPAAKKGMTTTAKRAEGRVKEGDQVPTWLFNADTLDDARQAHLERVRHCKANTIRIAPAATTPGARAAGDPLDVIRAAYQHDEHDVRQRRELVETERADALGRPRAEPKRDRSRRDL
jgi:hypothetical protein